MKSCKRLLAMCAAIMITTAVLLLRPPSPGSTGAASAQKDQPKNYSPYADRRYPTQVFWGDQHLHTSFSCDAGMVGDRLGPDEAFRFARGEQLRSSSGQLVRLERPFDWLVVSDHPEYLGMSQALADGDSAVINTAKGKEWSGDLEKGGKFAMGAFHEM